MKSVNMFFHNEDFVLSDKRLKVIIANNLQGASIIDFTQGEKHSIPVAWSLLKKFSVENFQMLKIFISPPNDKFVCSYIINFFISYT